MQCLQNFAASGENETIAMETNTIIM
jgi:hypothetical protein